MAEELPLFPLRAVLLPGGRLPMQIFEPRYLDLVSGCMKNDSGFGIVHITEGREVFLSRSDEPPLTTETGTLARIVDWDGLSHGRLRITVEGTRRFRVLSTRMEANRLVVGEIAWVRDGPAFDCPERFAHLYDIMAGLAQHPALKRLGVAVDTIDGGGLAYALAQYLPLREEDRYAILLEEDPLLRLEQIDAMVQKLGGSPESPEE